MLRLFHATLIIVVCSCVAKILLSTLMFLIFAEQLWHLFDQSIPFLLY